ncbi:MAG TPA: VWA domain-containing protein [Terracidiphilus sp.]|nr:VWA domain-containing protein [Terracidiphilus sp.]
MSKSGMALGVLLLAMPAARSMQAQLIGRPLQFPSHEMEEQKEGNRAEAQNKQNKAIFRLEVRRVPVDVVVRDAQGNVVEGLKKDDFEIEEDGKKQELLTFEFMNGTTPSYMPPKLPEMPPNTFVSLPSAPETGPLYVLYYDMVNTLREHQMAFRAELLRFVDTAPAGTRFALFVNAAGLHLVQGFTSDHAALRAAILRDGPGPHVPKVFLGGATELGPGEYGAGDTGAALSNLNFLAEYLGGIAGRKNLIWLADLFPIPIGPGPEGAYGGDPSIAANDDAKKAYANLMSSQISLYPVDLSGVAGGAQGRYQNEAAIGAATGGQAYYSDNDVAALMNKAVQHGSTYYALSYSPSNQKFDGAERKIAVKLKENGNCTLSYRRFYFAKPESDAKSTRKDEILQARFVEAKAADTLFANIEHGAPMLHDLLFSAHLSTVGGPALATSEQMEQLEDSPTYFKTRKRNRPVKPPAPVKLETYRIQYGVYDAQLKVKARDKGKPPKLEFAAAAYDADGKLLNSMLNDGLASPAPDANGKFGTLFHAEQQLEVPPGAAWIRLVVRDELNDQTGALEIPLPLKPATDSTQTAER